MLPSLPKCQKLIVSSKWSSSLILLHSIVMSLGGSATEEDADIIAKLFGSVGKIWRGDEKLFDAVTGLRYVASVNIE